MFSRDSEISIGRIRKQPLTLQAVRRGRCVSLRVTSRIISASNGSIVGTRKTLSASCEIWVSASQKFMTSAACKEANRQKANV